MTYIKLEDVRKIYNRNRYCQKISEGYTETYPNIVVDVIKINAIEEIETLPSINPEEIIEEMIKQFDEEDKYADSFDAYFDGISVGKSIGLKRLLPKFKS